MPKPKSHPGEVQTPPWSLHHVLVLLPARAAVRGEVIHGRKAQRGDFVVRRDGSLTLIKPRRKKDLDAVASGATTAGVCSTCGCTEDDACDFGCSWVTDTLCSTCAPGATA